MINKQITGRHIFCTLHKNKNKKKQETIAILNKFTCEIKCLNQDQGNVRLWNEQSTTGRKV
jgi:hypothetical protein